ncbi:chemotaxis protein CheW [Actinoplanes flavus]|uniref:Chemotaxis protein CheW n=1 Tax=Actinoplanes flavus TaxID=2820290 RepID=A0ABS3UJM9_9ACTN|nr:chemotaxis protein CheW [Actinoplanes flavus]MBO3738989.1 chemotaxis protein CheW [Actinoplanes flavus]
MTVAGRVTRLREEFDRSFAEPARVLECETVELLAVGAGDRPYALRLTEASGVHPDRPVTPLPTSIRALLGVAGFAGAVIPVYDLAALLGHPVPRRPRWLLLAKGTPPLALAFHELDRHLRVPLADVVDGADPRGCLRGMVRLPDGHRPIVDVPAVRELVHRLAGYRSVPEEAR